MITATLRTLLPISLALLAADATAFRNCGAASDSLGFRGQSHYLVGELEFDPDTGDAFGSETRYNFISQDASGSAECHVTYDIRGRYLAGSGLFLLEGERLNHSHTCEADFLDNRYPGYLSYTIQVLPSPDDGSAQLLTDTGEELTPGSWGAGHLSYKTPERCELL